MNNKLVVFKQKKKTAATLLGEAAVFLPVPDGENHQDTSSTCRCQQVLNDTADEGDVLGGLV